MIKVSVFYPHFDGATFDMTYYLDKHMALVRRLLGPALRGIAVEQGLGGMEAGAPPTYVAMGHLMFDSIEAVQKAMASHGPDLMNDVPNYTNIEPVIQVSDIKM